MDVRGNDKRQGGGGALRDIHKIQTIFTAYCHFKQTKKKKKTPSVTKAGKPAWQNALFGPFIQQMHSLLFLTFVIVT